ncbi:MAG TPA: ABC transporter permease [Chthoniobacterales bacterium]|nr:ABC transporter permease [Chthoniobacterales bacterium]
MIRDLKFAFRQLLKSPGFTAATVTTLALGIGANAAIFSVVNSVLLRPLPYKEPDQIWMLLATHQSADLDSGLISMADYLDYKEQATAFEQLAAFTSVSRDLTGGGEPERIQLGVVSHDLFPALGVAPALGRIFSPEEDRPAAERVAILSHEIWQRRFGSDPGLIGRAISIGDVPYVVIGIMPPGFRVAQIAADIWTAARGASPRDYRIFNLVGRPKAGVRIEQAQSEMSALAARLAQQYPETNAGLGLRLLPLREYLVGDVRIALLVLLGAVALVLLIACANVANLLLVRAISRQREIAIRTALGASRGRLMKQLVTEGLVLAGIGGAFGLLLSLGAISGLKNFLPADLPRLAEVRADWRVLTFCAGTTLLTGVIFGLLPALRITKQNLNDSLKGRGRGNSAGKTERRFRSALAIAELALAMILMAGAGLLIQSFIHLQQVDPGFNTRNLLTMQVSLPRSRYADDNRRAAFFAELISRLEKLPGVETAAATLQAPLIGLDVDKSTFTIKGAPPHATGQEPAAPLHVVTPEYFRTMNIPLRSGRALTERDDRNAPGVVIINEAMARRYWPNESPVGRQLKLGLAFLPGDAMEREIIGVVGNVRHFGLALNEEPQMYIPHRQSPWPEMTLVLRANPNVASLAAAARAQVSLMDRELPVAKVITMEQGLQDSVAQPRFRALLLGLFAALAVILGAIGLYSVMAYSVSQRTNEIGVRMALGANARDVMKMIFREGSSIVALGLIIGLAGALGLTRLLTSLLFGVGAGDPLTYAGISILLALVALLACYLPARRAMKVDPMVALRCE